VVPPAPEIPELKPAPNTAITRRQTKTIFGEPGTGIMGSQRSGEVSRKTLFGA
jgi:hypothetical protein